MDPYTRPLTGGQIQINVHSDILLLAVQGKEKLKRGKRLKTKQVTSPDSECLACIENFITQEQKEASKEIQVSLNFDYVGLLTEKRKQRKFKELFAILLLL